MFYTIDIFTRPSKSVPFFGFVAKGKALKSNITPANKNCAIRT